MGLQQLQLPDCVVFPNQWDLCTPSTTNQKCYQFTVVTITVIYFKLTFDTVGENRTFLSLGRHLLFHKF